MSTLRMLVLVCALVGGHVPQAGAAEHKLTGKWSGEYKYGADPGKKKTTLDLKEMKDGKFTGIWADGNSGGTEIKGTRKGGKMVFSYTYIHPKYGECKGDATGELSADGKTMKFHGVETGKYKSGKAWTEKWGANLKKE